VVRLDRQLSVVPDATSIATIVAAQKNYLIIENTFIDTGIAVQIFGTSIDHVIYGNKSTRTGGFTNWALIYNHVQPSWYAQFLNNEIVEGSTSSDSAISIWGAQMEVRTNPINFGTVVRHNLLRNAKVDINGFSCKVPGVGDAVVELNSISDSDVGIAIGRGTRNVLLRKNSFRNVATEIEGHAIFAP
jgi:hypothetical protein